MWDLFLQQNPSEGTLSRNPVLSRIVPRRPMFVVYRNPFMNVAFGGDHADMPVCCASSAKNLLLLFSSLSQFR